MVENKKGRIWQFDYLKAISIVFVIILHVSWTDTQKKCILFPFLINLAVPIFMIISGYMNAFSCDRHGIDTIGKWFAPRQFIKRVCRILIPYTLFFLIEVLIHFSVLGVKAGTVNFTGLIKIYLLGGWGPGSYYIPILIQLLIFFPFMYLLIKKYTKLGIIVLIATQLCMEWGYQLLGIDIKWYSVLMFRFIIFILCGMLLYQYRDTIQKKVILLMLVLGALYIIAITYLGYLPELFPYWTNISMPTVLWGGAIIYIALQSMKRLPGRLHGIISYVGKASLHIYLLQKVWYGSGWGEGLFHAAAHTLINVTFCIAAGCLLFWLEQKVLQRMSRGKNEN